ncbi:MAG: RIP metalloprotease RseP [Myxococcota bacterium]|nr:RIP metalloprotease RseP [Myxococcota bacterium]
MPWIVSLILALFALGFLIVVHEGGHYFVARWCGMRVERFSIGFGPGIKGLTHKSKKTGTVFQIAPIPFGGFVEIRGMNIAEEVDPDDKEAYPNRPAWQRFITIFAGPATNYLSAIVLAFCLFTCAGVDGKTAYFGVADVLSDYDAVGKLEKGDRILMVDDQPILIGEGASLTERVMQKKGAPVKLTVLRDGKQLEVTITPQPVIGLISSEEKTFADGRVVKNWPKLVNRKRVAGKISATELVFKNGFVVKKWPKITITREEMFLLGIRPTMQADKVDVGVIDAAGRALKYPVDQTRNIVAGLYSIVTGKEKADVGSVVRITDEFKQAFEVSFERGIQLLMMLSVYLGLFNLFPLPALDGGRLVFLGYEMVTRRRANPKIEAMIHMGGILVLGVLLILVTIKDCSRLVGG